MVKNCKSFGLNCLPSGICPRAPAFARCSSPHLKGLLMSTITTVSGLQYDEINVGDGAEATAGSHVTVHYTGWLQNDDGSAGSKFDSSKDRSEPFSFPLGAGHVIKG